MVDCTVYCKNLVLNCIRMKRNLFDMKFLIFFWKVTNSYNGKIMTHAYLTKYITEIEIKNSVTVA